MIGPNDIGEQAENELVEGQLDHMEGMDLELTDEEVNQIIGKRITTSEASWNKLLDLERVRKQNESQWLNKALDVNALYPFQVPYKNNRIFSATETLIPIVLSNPPQPVVTQAFDTDASYDLAQNLQKTLLALYEDLYIKAKVTMVARHLIVGMRIGVLKYRWDPNIGPLGEDGERKGGLVVETVRPDKIILDRGAKKADDIPLIAEIMDCTVEELWLKFPDKKEDIVKKFGGSVNAENNKGSRISYHEIHFTYYDSKGEKREAVAWKYQDLLLGKMKSPNWNYDETKKDKTGKSIRTNFFDHPQKPYIIFNYLNLGKYVIDDTSLTDQATPLQDVLNKRGRQIVENADQANSGSIFNEEMISQDDVSRITGDPIEKVMVKGNVNEAATRLPINLLPPYVIDDKLDARQEIDNIYGTNAPLRGEKSNAKTLGQEVISQRSNMSRLQTLADSLEDGMDRLYKGLVQMMKVFWDEPTMVKYTGKDGQTTFIEFSNDKIEDGVAMRIKAGSILPHDKQAEKMETLQLAPILDPLSLAEGLDKYNPKEFAARITLFKLAPDMYFKKYLNINSLDGNDQQAQQDLQMLMRGQPVQPPDNPSKEYVATFANLIQSPEFSKIPPQIQQVIIAYAKQVLDKGKGGLGIQGGATEQTGAPQGTGQAGMPAPAIAPQAPQQEPPQGPAAQGFA